MKKPVVMLLSFFAASLAHAVEGDLAAFEDAKNPYRQLLNAVGECHSPNSPIDALKAAK